MRKIFTILIVALFGVVATAKAEGSVFDVPYKNAIKVTFLSWASGSTKISYERAFPECKQAGEICASIIGAGYDKYKNNPLGFTLRYGHKFFVAGYKKERPMMGFYLRPELIYSHYDYTTKAGAREPVRMGAILGTFGYQLCVKRFVADAWVGAGYCDGKMADTGYYHGFQTFDWLGKHSDNIALSFSIRLGVLF